MTAPRDKPDVGTVEEYVNDVAYTRHFIPEMSPQHLRLVAALNGIAPPPGDEFDYLEVGCAHGDSLCAVAAAHPRASFLGVDISPMHIASAKRLARDGALENIGFLERDFETLLHDDEIGPFDFIAAYGLLSWISPEKRKALLELVNAKLKPGGLFFVSYNAMPGWSAVEPLRQLLLSPLGADGAGGGTGDASETSRSSMDRARRGLEFAQSMERAGADYFVKNPSASGMLATMALAGLPYLIHEYLHEHWAPMYFARVAWELLPYDLHFVGVSPTFLNFVDTAVAPPLEPIFGTIKDRVTFESLRDFAVNEFFRRDVYVKGPGARSEAVTNAYIDATPWGQSTTQLARERKVRLPHREISLEDPIFDAILGVIAEGATTGTEIARRRELAGHSADDVRAAIKRLVLTERISPMRHTTRARPGAGPETVYEVHASYNQMVLRKVTSELPLLLASDAAGTAFPISALDGLALRILSEVPAKDRARWIQDFVGRSVLRFRIGERVIEEPVEQAKAIAEAVATAIARADKLVELGIMSPRQAGGR